jgi:hypothetical protein
MLVERFDAADKAYAIDQKNCYISSLGTRRGKKCVLALQGLLSHLEHPNWRFVLRGTSGQGRHTFRAILRELVSRKIRTLHASLGPRVRTIDSDTCTAYLNSNGHDLCLHRFPCRRLSERSAEVVITTAVGTLIVVEPIVVEPIRGANPS